MFVKFPKKFTYKLSLLLSVKCVVVFASFGKGKCPVLENAAIVVWPNFQGDWYEYASYGDYISRTLYKCMKYTFNTTETEVSAVHYFVSKWTDGLSTLKYNILPDGFYDFIMEIDSDSTFKMWVLDTDYGSYAILRTCKDYSFEGYYVYEESSWILTRSNKQYTTTQEEIAIDEALAKHSVKRIDYDLVSRQNCPYIRN